MRFTIEEMARYISRLDDSSLNDLSQILVNEHNISNNMFRFGFLDRQIKFDIYLEKNGRTKLALVKSIKEHLGLGLKAAKDIVDNTPCVILKDVDIDYAEKLVDEFENCGATIKLI